MSTAWQKTIDCNLVNNDKMCFNSILIHYWKKTNNVTSPSPLKMDIHKQEVTFVSLVIWQEVVPLLAKKKLCYYSFKMNIKVQNMNISVWSFVLFRNSLQSFESIACFVYISAAHSDSQLSTSMLTLIEAIL